MLYELLEVQWGHQGFISWLENLSLRYSHRLKIILNACEAINVNLDKSSHLAGIQTAVEIDLLEKISRLESAVLATSLKNGVQVTKGSLFRSSNVVRHQLHFRVTFAAAKEGDLAEGVRRFGAALKQHLYQ